MMYFPIIYIPAILLYYGCKHHCDNKFTDIQSFLFISLLFSRMVITFANSLDPDQDRQKANC